ncbi:MAG: hypothetical protein P8M20_10925, partial [Planctomycetaceae bacterium]|nr:hypothetical protein [Planctomycetaceae bacterium]
MTNPLKQSDLTDFIELLEIQLENRITAAQFEQLEETIRSNSAARRFYLQYMDLHGALQWDLAATADADRAASEGPQPASENAVTTVREEAVETFSQSKSARWVAMAASVCCILLVFVFSGLVNDPQEPGGLDIVGSSDNEDALPPIEENGPSILTADAVPPPRNI